MKKDKKEAKEKGLDNVELKDEDFSKYKESLEEMKKHDKELNDEKIEQEYKSRKVKRS